MTKSVKFFTTATIMAICIIGFIVKAIAPPQPPVAAPATNIKNDSFTANWSGVSGATAYKLDVSTESDFKTFVPGYNNLNVTSTNQLVSGLSCRVHYYRVKSVEGNVQSAHSKVIAVQLCDKQ